MQSKSYQKIELLKEPSVGVEIKVKEPAQEAGGNFISYMIIGVDKTGSFESRRRFNEFFLLRQGLAKSWPGLYIPPIPDKKMIGNKQDKFIEERRRFLEYFCQQVAKISYLYYSEIFQQFLRNKTMQLQTINGQIERTPTADKLTLFKELFIDSLTGKEPVHELKSRISHFNLYLKKSEKQLDRLRDSSREIAQSFRMFNTAFNLCTNLVLPEYEKNILKEYVDEDTNQLPFLHNNLLGEKARLYRDQSEINPIEFLVDLITFEHRETIAFQEAIEMKQQLESKKRKLEEKRVSQQSELTKLMSGKTTFKSIFSRGSKNDQIGILEKSVAEDAKEIQNLEVLLNVVTVVLSREITKYKEEKQVQYLELLSTISALENQKLNIYGGLMRSIAMAYKSIKV